MDPAHGGTRTKEGESSFERVNRVRVSLTPHRTGRGAGQGQRGARLSAAWEDLGRSHQAGRGPETSLTGHSELEGRTQAGGCCGTLSLTCGPAGKWGEECGGVPLFPVQCRHRAQLGGCKHASGTCLGFAPDPTVRVGVQCRPVSQGTDSTPESRKAGSCLAPGSSTAHELPCPPTFHAPQADWGVWWGLSSAPSLRLPPTPPPCPGLSLKASFVPAPTLL